MTAVVTILCLLTGILYIPFAVIIINLPAEALYSIGFRNRNTTAGKLLMLPFRVLNRFTRGGLSRYSMFAVGLIPSLTIRKAYYRLCGVKAGKNTVFHYKTEIRCPVKLKIGEGTIIGDNAILDARSGITMGSNVNLSSNVSIYTLQHNHRSPEFNCEFPERSLEVTISDRAWLGSNVMILPGVRIGEGAVVCAGAVVTKDVGGFEIVAGIPAKKVGIRPQNLTYRFNGTSCWFI